MNKIIMVRLPERVAKGIEKIAERKGLPLSTAIRELVCEHLYTLAELPAKPPTSVADPQPKKDVVPACQ